MFFEYKEGLQELKLCDRGEQQLVFGLCNLQEFALVNEEYFQFSKATLLELENVANARVANKMDSYYGYCFGILHDVEKIATGFQRIRLGLYIQQNLVLVVCDDERLSKRLYDAVDKINERTFCLEHIISSLMEALLWGKHDMLDDMEEYINGLDERVMDNKIDNMNQKISDLRHDTLLLTHYYEQLIDVCEELLEDENAFFKETNLHHIRIFTDRVNRLASGVRLLRDYTMQVKESYQSQVAINLNQIMYVFTVVTTVFLPLTLIVGWYGMNFTTMPELEWSFGYLFVILLSVSVIIVCIWFFKRKRLFLRK